MSRGQDSYRMQIGHEFCFLLAFLNCPSFLQCVLFF